MTDARHGWRKNAKDSSIVAIGDLSHKVLACEHVTKSDEIISQKHELVGTKRIALDFANENIDIGIWAHDNNGSVNNFIRTLPDPTCNQNETWHGIKNVKKELSKVTNGPKYQEGKLWHRQLRDKLDPISTHIQYSMRNCEGDPIKLRDRLDTIVPHYKGNHEKCDDKSRCKTDQNYEPGHLVITDQKGEDILIKAIQKTIIYKRPQNFCFAKDIYYVESFNNCILMFISFSDHEYLTRSRLAVLHWNENVDRDHTSIHHYHNSRKTTKNLKKMQFSISQKIMG